MISDYVELNEVKKKIGSYGKIADLVAIGQLEACFRVNGYVAFATYDEYFNDTIHSIELVNEIFIADNTTELSEVISGTGTIYETVGAVNTLTKLRPIPKTENEVRSGWLFLKRNTPLLEQVKQTILRSGSISGVVLFDKHQASTYSVRLIRDNLFITTKSFLGYLNLNTTSSITAKKSTGKSPLKAEAQSRARALAKQFWKEEQESGSSQTKLLSMAKKIRAYFKDHEPEHHKQTTSDESVKEWIRDVAPEYARNAGRSTSINT